MSWALKAVKSGRFGGDLGNDHNGIHANQANDKRYRCSILHHGYHLLVYEDNIFHSHRIRHFTLLYWATQATLYAKNLPPFGRASSSGAISSL